jgi:aminoglycoside 6-adenylyltransferase
MPDLMTLPGYAPQNERNSFAYLVLFKDVNRIDLTLFPVEKIADEFAFDSLSVLLLDKDGLFPNLPPSSERDYLIKKPTEKEFLDVCNEFWWVAPYVAKGLQRQQITYVKEMLETVLRKMFMKILEWQIGEKHGFAVNFGASGKNLKKLVEPEFYDEILATYPDGQIENIWKSLFLMTEVFDRAAANFARQMGFAYNRADSANVRQILQDVRALPQNTEDF